MDNRAISLVISALMLTAAMVIIVYTSYQWGTGVIESGKEAADSMLAQRDLESIDNAIKTVAHEGKWSTRVVSVSSEFGFESNKTEVTYDNSNRRTLDTPKITSCNQFIQYKPKIIVDEDKDDKDMRKMTIISYSINFTLPHKHVVIKNMGSEKPETFVVQENVTIDSHTYRNISGLTLHKINLLVS